MSAMVEIHETYNTTYPTLFSYFKIGQLIFQAMLIFTPALPIALILLIKPVFLNIKWLFTIGIISEILLTGLAIYYHITNLI